jgi:hypothetical protein
VPSRPLGFGGVIYIKIVQGTSQDGTLSHSLLHLSGSPSTTTLKFLLVRNKLISFTKFDEKSNFNSLYSEPGCYVLSNAFPIFKNTTAIDIMFLKLRLM